MNRYYKVLVSFLFCLVLGKSFLYAQTDAGKQAFYTALASNDISLWDKQLKAAKQLKANEKNAFEGALLMRKSASLKVPAQKLSTFKQGHKLLETAIRSESPNVEFKFLRLMIQENAPKILGYNKNIPEDVKAIKTNYKLLPKTTQEAISVYSKSSKLLSGL